MNGGVNDPCIAWCALSRVLAALGKDVPGGGTPTMRGGDSAYICGGRDRATSVLTFALDDFFLNEDEEEDRDFTREDADGCGVLVLLVAVVTLVVISTGTDSLPVAQSE